MKNKFNKIFTLFIFIISIFAFSSCNINWFNDWMEDMYNQAALRHWEIKVYFEEELSPECTLTVEDSDKISKPVNPKTKPISEEYPDLNSAKFAESDIGKLHTFFVLGESFFTWFENATFTVSLHSDKGIKYEGQIFIKEAIQGYNHIKCELTNTNNKDDKIICYFMYVFYQSI